MMGNDESIDLPRDALESYVAKKIIVLQQTFLEPGNQSDAARRLAILRRAASKDPGSSPEVWAIEFEGMPESLVGRTGEPSRGEWSIHAVLTLYAIHQQSRTEPMYVSGREHGLGAAVRVLVDQEGKSNLKEGEPPRRFAALATANSLAEALHYSRQLVGQLRAKSIPLDYVRLAKQLYDFQNPYRIDGVRLAWGREYTSRHSADAPSEDISKVSTTLS